MTQTRKIKIQVANFILEGYQGEEGIFLFTHRQIGEAVGKTKEASQRYIKKRESELPPAVKATIPERKGLIALTQWESAKVFWQYQADMGNDIAQAIMAVIGDKSMSEVDIIDNSNSETNNIIAKTTQINELADRDSKKPTSTSQGEVTAGEINPLGDKKSNILTSDTQVNELADVASKTDKLQDNIPHLSSSVDAVKTSTAINSFVNNYVNMLGQDLKVVVSMIEIASGWMQEAGIDEKAISCWKLKELGKQVPELQGLVSSALEIITSNSNSPSGMIVSQLATELSAKMGTKVTPAKVNQALHDLELQDWAKPGVNRERKLTSRGQQYGVALLTTSADGWQGAQLRWYDSVIPLLCQYFNIKQ